MPHHTTPTTCSHQGRGTTSTLSSRESSPVPSRAAWNTNRCKALIVALVAVSTLLILYATAGLVTVLAFPQWLFGSATGATTVTTHLVGLIALPLALLVVAASILCAAVIALTVASARAGDAPEGATHPFSALELLLPPSVARVVSLASLRGAQMEAAKLKEVLRGHREGLRRQRQGELEELYMQPLSGTSVAKYMSSWRVASSPSGSFTDADHHSNNNNHFTTSASRRTSTGVESSRSNRTNYTNRLRDALAANNVMNLTPLYSKAVPQAWVGFCDMVDFTPMCSTCSPSEVLGTLTQLFSLMDALAADCDVQKIKTIGDAYMCYIEPTTTNTADDPRSINSMTSSRSNFPLSSGSFASTAACWDHQEAPPPPSTTILPDSHPSLRVSGLRMLHFLLESISLCTLIQRPNGPAVVSNREVQLRGGMHFGPVATGVLGFDRPMFDVFGNTVNIAARLEATGVPQRVHMTKASSDLLAPVVPSFCCSASAPPRPAPRNREDSEVRELCNKRLPFNSGGGAAGISPDLIPIFQVPPPSLIHVFPVAATQSDMNPNTSPAPPPHRTNNNHHHSDRHQSNNNTIADNMGTPRNDAYHHMGGGEDTFLEGCFFGTISFDMLSRRKTSTNNSPTAGGGTSPVHGISPVRSPRSCFSISSASEWHFSEGVGGVPIGGGDGTQDGATWVVLKGVGSIQTVLIESYEPPVVWPSPEGEEWADLVATAKDRAKLIMEETGRVTSCISLLPPPPIRILGTTHNSASTPTHTPPNPTLTSTTTNTATFKRNIPPLDLQPISSSLGDPVGHFPTPTEEELESLFKPNVINLDDGGYDRG